MILRFGKFKGQKLSETPQWYQDWLLKQPWFKAPKKTKTNSDVEDAHRALRGWDGFSRKGQAAYDRIFEWEKKMAEAEDCRTGICTCCEGSMYYGL